LATEGARKLPNLRADLKALTKEGHKELQASLDEADELYTVVPSATALGLFDVSHGRLLREILNACSGPGDQSARFAPVLESRCMSGRARSCREWMADKYDVLLDVVMILRLAYGSLMVRDFGLLISSWADNLSKFGEANESEVSYKLNLADGGVFTMGTPKAADRRKFSSLASAKLCQKALFYFFEVLRFMHCADVNYFAHHQALGNTLFEQLDLQVEGDIDSLHLFLERVWQNFCASVRDTCHKAERVSPEAPLGWHVGVMLRCSIRFFDESDSLWWATTVDKARRRRVNNMVDATESRLLSLQEQFSSLHAARRAGGGGSSGGGGGGVGNSKSARAGGRRDAAGGKGGGAGRGAPLSASSLPGSKSKVKRDRASAKQEGNSTPKRLKLDGAAPTPKVAAWAAVELGFAGNKLAKPDECRKALLDGGYDNAGAARMVWGKEPGNQGQCFWANSAFGKAGGGCCFPGCKFGPPGHNG
jgi:uncharacterized membrane protein YgcG